MKKYFECELNVAGNRVLIKTSEVCRVTEVNDENFHGVVINMEDGSAVATQTYDLDGFKAQVIEDEELIA